MSFPFSVDLYLLLPPLIFCREISPPDIRLLAYLFDSIKGNRLESRDFVCFIYYVSPVPRMVSGSEQALKKHMGGEREGVILSNLL